MAAKALTALLGRETHIVADEDTNTVLVLINADKIKKAKELIKPLDVKSCFCLIAVGTLSLSGNI
jgi:hypothetical protein